MRINQRPLIGGGGSGDRNSFSDSFPGGTTFGFGSNWLWAGMNYQLGAISQFGPAFITGGNAIFQATAVNQVISLPVGFMPIPPMFGLAGKNQFAQATFISSNGLVGTRGITAGVSVLNGWDNAGDYKAYILVCTVDNVNSALNLYRWASGAIVTLAALGNGTAIPNDVHRLEVRLSSSSNQLKVFRNGVLINTTVDNGATRPRFGSPGLHRVDYASNAAPGTSEIKFASYSCGVAA